MKHIHIHAMFVMHTHEWIVFASFLTSVISSMASCLVWQVFLPAGLILPSFSLDGSWNADLVYLYSLSMGFLN